ncbi:MAG: DUF1641 domain-containing protein [Haloarculaceae archaeon]
MSETEPDRDDAPADAALDADARATLAEAIEENPDAVAAFVDRLDAANELLDALELGTEAVDDRMVADLAGTGALLAESADGLATRETAALAESVGENADDLDAALATLVRLQRTGTLDDLAELADVASLATSAVDDEMVTTLARTGGALGGVADAASDPEAVRGIETLVTALGEADAGDPEPVGAVGLVRSLRDPDVKRGLGYLLSVARSTGRELDRRDAE